MSRVGQNAMAEAVQLKGECGGEAALHASDETAIESGEDTRGTAVKLRQRTHGPDNDGDVHGGLEAFAADIAKDDQGCRAIQWDDLEEVAAHLLSRIIGAGDGVAGNLRNSLGYQYMLNFPRRSQLTLADGLLSDHPRESQKYHRPDREQENCIRQVARLKRERSQTEGFNQEGQGTPVEYICDKPDVPRS